LSKLHKDAALGPINVIIRRAWLDADQVGVGDSLGLSEDLPMVASISIVELCGREE
jgi:hypothetical protein